MITIEDKISSFQKIINEDISEKAQKEIDEYILETEEKVSKYKEKKQITKIVEGKTTLTVIQRNV